MEYDGYEFSEITREEMIQAVKARIREYESRKFNLLFDLKAESMSSNPDKLGTLRQMHRQNEDLDHALEMCRTELSKLEGSALEELPTEVDPRLVRNEEMV